MKRIRQILTALVILGVIGAAAYYSLAPRPTLVEAVEATRGPLQVSIVEEGKTRVADRYVVSAPVSGTLRRLNFEVGDQVRKGQAITHIEPPPASALDPRARAEAKSAIAVAEATIERAKEDVETARSDAGYWEAEVPRLRDGVEAGVTARTELDQAEANERKAKSALRAAEQQVEVARSQLESAQVRLEFAAASTTESGAPAVAVIAPVSGKVLEIMQKSAAVVQASQPLVAIADPKGLEVQVEVLSSDAVQIREGMRVLLERWGGPQPLEGVVRRVEPVAFTKVSALGVEEQRVLVIVDIISPKDEWLNLGDQYRVEARFILSEEDNALQVPSSALFRHDGGWAVFRAGEKTASLQPVEIGKRSGLTTEIVSGLSEGDRVINHPPDTVADGGLVEYQ